jgi:DNA topoisomerase-3
MSKPRVAEHKYASHHHHEHNMKLYLAEKPSLGKAIATALPTPHHKAEGCIYVGHADRKKCDIVSWCIGHLLEQAEPDAYDASLKKWALAPLPILPESFDSGWKLLPKTKTRKQFSILKKLIKQASHIIHCGDPDREGQLLVDEVINHVGVSKTLKNNIKRCLISDLNTPAVKAALANLKSNQDFAALSISALARSRADWLYGMNLTRAYTLQAQTVGFQGVVSIGRVQTPILGLVVRRDLEIEVFTPQSYYEVDAHLISPQQEVFTARWQPSEACEKYQDSEGRVLNKALAENVVARINRQPATVEKVEDKHKKQAPPLPYSLSVLQIEAAKRYGLSAKMVLDVCQNLYERHKLITYPRSDNRYLPAAHFRQASQVMQAITKNSNLSGLCQQANTKIKSKAWNDAKVSAHHAIIPTENTTKQGVLSRAEQQIYDLISKHYICQFFPAWEYTDSRIELTIAGGLFVSKARITRHSGWKQVFQSDQKKAQPDVQKNLPELTSGQKLLCDRGELLEKITQAPKHFTDASLLAAMTGIARYVADPEIKKVLKETDGLGTEATRASIIELLFKRQFLQRQGKQIHATTAGKGVIKSLPEEMTLPDMTAKWELMLEKISLREHNYRDFMQPLQAQIASLLTAAKSNAPQALAGIKQVAFSKKKRKPSKRTKKPASSKN